MILDKALLLKGLVGVTALGATATSIGFGVKELLSSRNIGSNKKPNPKNNINPNLNCDLKPSAGNNGLWSCVYPKTKERENTDKTDTNRFTSVNVRGRIKIKTDDNQTSSLTLTKTTTTGKK